ncbi:protein pbn1 [Diplocarpon rosae]|nr:protein pbn1 [Diplocarpon rosae]
MRQRITFLQEPNDSIDPSKISVTDDSISTPELIAAREERVTFGFDELPQELYRVLKASHELHVRWVREGAFETRAPLVARLSPGLHVFYTPLSNKWSSDRFSHSAAWQYYSPLPTLLDFTSYLTHKLCASRSFNSGLSCNSRVQALLSASTLDLDFDTISHVVTLSAFFAPQTQALSLSKTTSLSSSRMEVGILSVEKALETEELSLGGFLTVLGESTKPAPTLFSFPARHHPLPLSQTFTSEFVQPTGLHPMLQLNITSFAPPLDYKACSLHAHLTLPRAIFLDKYQFSDPLFLASKNLSKLHYITTPVDLEAPAYALTAWGSSVLLELSPPPQYPSSSSAEPKQWTTQIPLHLRYLPPASNSSGQSQLEVPYPVLFWACTADEGTKFPINPFDRVNLGYDGLFGPRTLFFHLSPSALLSGRLVNGLSVPVLDLDQSGYVQGATAIGVLLGFTWVCRCLFKVWMSAGYGSVVETKVVGRDKKMK